MRLASATFTGESSAGWQTLTLAKPVALQAGASYVASHHAPVGRYNETQQEFNGSRPIGNAVIRALAGLYAYSTSTAYPTHTWNAAGYGVDVLFQPNAATTNSKSPTASPAPITTAPTPTASGKPVAANTGVPPRTVLRVVTGNQLYSTPGQVISGLNIRGSVTINASNVILQNSIVRGGAAATKPTAVINTGTKGGVLINDSEIAPAHPNAWLDGVDAQGATLLRLNLHGTVNGVKAFDNVTVQDSYIHDLDYSATQPNGVGQTHNDDVQTYGGNHNITLLHNDLSAGPGGNAAYQVTQDLGSVSINLRIQNNWLDGGGCMLNFSSKGGPTPMTGICVTGNRFGRGSSFACPILLGTHTVPSANTGKYGTTLVGPSLPHKCTTDPGSGPNPGMRFVVQGVLGPQSSL